MSACRSSAGRLFHSFGQTDRQTACMYTHSLVTLKRIYTVIASTCRQLLRDLSDTSQTSEWMSVNCLRLNMEKIELLWVGSRYSISQQGCCLPVLQYISVLTQLFVCWESHFRPILVSSDTCRLPARERNRFYWLRRLMHCQCSLEAVSAATLVLAFVSSRVDYCNAVLAFAPKVTACGQVATRVSGNRHQ